MLEAELNINAVTAAGKSPAVGAQAPEFKPRNLANTGMVTQVDLHDFEARFLHSERQDSHGYAEPTRWVAPEEWDVVLLIPGFHRHVQTGMCPCHTLEATVVVRTE